MAAPAPVPGEYRTVQLLQWPVEMPEPTLTGTRKGMTETPREWEASSTQWNALSRALSSHGRFDAGACTACAARTHSCGMPEPEELSSQPLFACRM